MTKKRLSKKDVYNGTFDALLENKRSPLPQETKNIASEIAFIASQIASKDHKRYLITSAIILY